MTETHIFGKNLAYWRSAIINQTAHAAVGALAMLFLHATLGYPAWIVLSLIYVGAWIREFWQKDWRVFYALTRWRKHNDVMWFVIGGFAVFWLTL
jgi:hypothetical protein